jgi:hypothetical protein
MTRIRRLLAVTAILALTAVFTSSHLWGDSGSKPRTRPPIPGGKIAPDTPAASLGEDLASSKFAKGGVLTYRTKHGDTLFALQLKPQLDRVPDRPRDYLILVDTSASQVGPPLTNAQMITKELVKTAGVDDRIAIWTCNIAAHDLTRGFRGPKDGQVQDALKTLQNEVPLGDTDLPKAVDQVIKSYVIDGGRQRVLVFLGDGMSVHNPINPSDRVRICQDLIKNEIGFFPVPLGPRLDPQNLHGFASGSGGKVVRLLATDKVGDTVGRLIATAAAPILYPSGGLQLAGAEVAETFPTRLPPLRGDAPTLVIGRIGAGKELAYTVEGTVAGREVRVSKTEAVSESELDNFFLVGMFEQWKNAKDQPALMQADRALAFAQEVNQMARAELLAQAHEALTRDKLDAAGKLFAQAKQLDPADVEAEGGLKVVQKLRDGKLTRDQLRRQFAHRDGIGLRLEKDASGNVQVRKERLDKLLAQAKPDDAADKAPPGKPEVAPPVDPNDLLKQQKLRQAVEEQRIQQSTEDALREARRIYPTDPDAARDLLERTLGVINDNFDIGERIRRDLAGRLENALRTVRTEGIRIKENQAERLKQLALAQERIQLENARNAAEERTQARMRVFHTLMNQGRYEESYRQALAITQDALSQGAPVPVAVTAAYTIGLTAQNLKEVQELKRIREERFLLTMMQVEKSHVPFPDEPPIQYPPAATWREITKIRKERYENSGFTEEDPSTLKRIKELQNKMTTPVTVEFESGPLKDALGFLQERYNIPIIIDTDAFKADLSEPDIENKTVKLTKLSGISLGTVLRLLLAQVQGTYIIRREFIEVTTGQRQASEKTIRVYPVADLVIPIPRAVNQQSINQQIQNSILGFQIDLARAQNLGGLGLGGLAGLGGFGGAVGIGGLAGIGGIGGGIGGLGGLGGIGGLGGVGGGLAGAAGLGGGPVNLGVGGGMAGFAGFGGQLGQFGNLGGQFGLQGGDQSAILIRLIRQVVGQPRDWAGLGVYDRGQGVGVPQAGRDADDEPTGDPNEAGAVGYYPPSLALVVKGTSRIHTRLGGGLLGPRAPAPAAPDKMGANDLNKIKDQFLAKSGAKDDKLRDKAKKGDIGSKLELAAADNKRDKERKKEELAAKTKKSAPVTDLDAKKIWQEALAKGVNEPGLIIAVADFLVEHQKFDHAAEFLKANLRQAIVARPWVYEALAVALKESKGSPEDIERAQLSIVDMEPQDAEGYLRASQAMADGKRWDRAVAFCRQASLLEPDAPRAYEEALLFAELSKDTEAMQWAAGNLLSRDWPVENQELHDKAKDKLNALTRLLEGEKREDDASRMAAAVQRQQHRDLVINLTWQGEADLHLEVKEPVGTICTPSQRQTPGGGVLLGGTCSEPNRESYLAAQGFSGDFEVRVRRVWGRPLGSKATVEIIEHQGTPQETLRRETVVVDQSNVFKISLSQGRRKTLAHVPPASAYQKPKAAVAQAGAKGGIIEKLRSVADPDLYGSKASMRGGIASSGSPVGPDFQPPPPGGGGPGGPGQPPIVQQPIVSPFANNLDMTAQAMVTADRRYVRLSVAGTFQITGAGPVSPIVTIIPGFNQP